MQTSASKSRTGETPGKHPARSRLIRLLLPAVASLGLSGCLFDRVLEVKQQACDFDENFELQFGGEPAIRLQNPVLLDSDIVWLVGGPATSRVETANGMRLSYEIEEDRTNPNPENDVRVHFDFVPSDGRLRLDTVHLDSRASLFFNPALLHDEAIRTASREACEFRMWPGSTSVELDIDEEALAWLPTKAEIVEQFGPPHEITDAEDGWVYGFRLKGAEDRGSARITLWFAEDGQKPLRLESRYSRYQVRADFDARILSMNLDL